ncbi:hypothetical protein MLC59_18515 [Marinobacter bryozoorum]|uniref:hypothetical protein n=1 Tax=Marinobacter bryozoorum TaxID=256324 RepID=UPI00200393B0|nr:hypothetical protein [Marinobacter bryozoorum]MCK7546155.1 hypothetical protein [Marinobacter bryozoorum]
MKKFQLLGVVLATVYLGGCATNNQADLSPELQNELDKPLYCEGEADCKAVWERATFFVNNNAGFKLQIHNDTIIQTFNPTQNSPRLAFSISKEPLGDGRYQIWTKAWCANMFGCQPNQYEAIAKAKKYMRTGNR